jgi:hypothetical protein
VRDPATSEEHDVEHTVALTAAVRRLGGSRLLFARLDWERLFSSASPPGAPTPTVARATLTRQAMKDAAARQKARRAATRSGRDRAMQKLLAWA